ncbi:putative zinc-type alcohol dehydrogenase-like protein YogA [Tolypocladium ophioglossoides CBS 100239]|uniref:Putative zinc-type alcohol dehydrogenase-like protein YogA n=1 Tax=Tolypocladium ophioglossoides (strain CBS 100239) TaxID=1163406 RepID=A0A0L0NG64_TOLOC|nr:putative zinc-type alcohol dehydrogenase-like protein YogA [Tolypocladium ophioglossoides CBS 100239]
MPRALTLKKIDGKPGEVYYPHSPAILTKPSLQVSEVPKPEPGPHEVLVRLSAAALNHRDLFIRHHQYPAISFTNALLADGYGVVVQTGPAVTRAAGLLDKPVILTPMRGWESDPAGPEPGSIFGVTGGSRLSDVGTAQDYVVVHEDEVEPAPAHLSPTEAAALPLVGLTGWRALVTKAGCASPGKNVLITGIGGGVALQVLQFAVAFGCNVFVTSGDQAKIDRAEQIGAKGGVIYKNDAWEKDLQGMLPSNRPFLDAVIDGAGGNIVSKSVRLLKAGGVIVQYGMTVSPKMDWLMQAVLANVELKGTTMGSLKEFRDMVAFVADKKIKPIVSRTVKGLSNIEAIDGLFADMEAGRQFGKLVIEIDDGGSSPKL